MEQYVPWIISGLSLLLAYLTFNRNGNKDKQSELDEIHESLLKANLKLDSACSSLSEIRTDIKSMHNALGEHDKRLTILERDLEKCFSLIDDLK